MSVLCNFNGMCNFSEMLALFGGTFDPPHLGHRKAITGLLKNPGVNRVAIIPAANPPLKSTLTPIPHRLKMTQIAFGHLPQTEVSLIEVLKNSKSPELQSYTFDTLLECRKRTEKIAFVIGTDQLASLPKWHRFPEILELCHWIILERKEFPLYTCDLPLRDLCTSGIIQKASDAPLAYLTSRTKKTLMITPTDAPLISSSTIRAQIQKTGKIPENTLEFEVADYLIENRLYGMTGGGN